MLSRHSSEHISGPLVIPCDRLRVTLLLQVLSWIDICAGLAAKVVARGPVVTASVDSVHFLRPCRLGSVAIVAAQVNRAFQSSMEVIPCHAYCSSTPTNAFAAVRLHRHRPEGLVQSAFDDTAASGEQHLPKCRCVSSRQGSHHDDVERQPSLLAETLKPETLNPYVQVGVRVEEEDMRTGARHHCCSAYLTFVSVLARAGADGRPARRMKRVLPTLPHHHEIFEAAERCGAFFALPSCDVHCPSVRHSWMPQAMNEVLIIQALLADTFLLLVRHTWA